MPGERAGGGVPICDRQPCRKTAMSANGHPALISAHADFRHQDYVFARTQSRETAAREWDHRTAPLQSWSQFLYPALGVAAAVLAVAEIVH